MRLSRRLPLILPLEEVICVIGALTLTSLPCGPGKLLALNMISASVYLSTVLRKLARASFSIFGNLHGSVMTH